MKEEMEGMADIYRRRYMFKETQGSLRCLAAMTLPPGADKDQWVDQVSMRMERMQFANLCGCGMLATEIPGTV